jgi:hypothetical protein
MLSRTIFEQLRQKTQEARKQKSLSLVETCINELADLERDLDDYVTTENTKPANESSYVQFTLDDVQDFYEQLYDMQNDMIEMSERLTPNTEV